MVNSRFPLVSAAFNASPASGYTHPAPLLPKLRGHFAEFLNHGSLDRLGILYLTTCVGLGYGSHIHKFRGFSWKHRITEFVQTVVRTPHNALTLNGEPDLPNSPVYTLIPRQPTLGSATLLRPPIASSIGTGILTCFPSTTHFCLALGAD